MLVFTYSSCLRTATRFVEQRGQAILTFVYYVFCCTDTTCLSDILGYSPLKLFIFN